MKFRSEKTLLPFGRSSLFWRILLARLTDKKIPRTRRSFDADKRPDTARARDKLLQS